LTRGLVRDFLVVVLGVVVSLVMGLVMVRGRLGESHATRKHAGAHHERSENLLHRVFLGRLIAAEIAPRDYDNGGQRSIARSSGYEPENCFTASRACTLWG
jgi:hypothetical protein